MRSVAEKLKLHRGRGLGLHACDRKAPWLVLGPFAAAWNAPHWRFGVGLIKWQAAIYIGPITISLGRIVVRGDIANYLPHTFTITTSERAA